VAGNVGKRRQLLAARARGLSLVDAAREAGMSTRQAERLNKDPTFKVELAQRLAELDAEEALGRREYGRQVAALARFALAKQAALMNDQNTPAVLVARVAKDVEDIDVRLRPAALDVSLVSAELTEEQPQQRSFTEIYGLPEDADQADVIDTIRATYVSSDRVRATYEQIRSRREARRSEFPPPERGERPGLQVVPAEPDPAPVEPVPVVSAVEVEARWNELLSKHTLTPDEQAELEQLPGMLMAARLRDAPDRSGQYSTSRGGR
jgi:hypothetical protein